MHVFRIAKLVDNSVFVNYVFDMVHRGRHGHGHGRGASEGRGPRRGGTRCRWWAEDPGQWEVHARVERFVEPALLLVLRDVDTHGYDLADAVEAMQPDERVDLGNLYRLLRGLEEEGFVTSEWHDDRPGRAKRTYQLTEQGATLLATWAESLRGHAPRSTNSSTRRYEQGVTDSHVRHGVTERVTERNITHTPLARPCAAPPSAPPVAPRPPTRATRPG